ncbi:hypothetical protein COCNU_scaffold003089G000010 [Cocos nucifera]|nr:hypothetical protein [Cocos nucifera]
MISRMCIATDRASFSIIEMDTQAIEILTKGLYTKKRKGKVPNDGSKRAKVSVSSSEVFASTIAASEVIVGIETALTAKSDHQMLTYIKRAHHQEGEARKAQEDLQVEIHHIQERVDEIEHLAEEKVVDIGSLQGALCKEEFISIGLKAALVQEEERRKKVENRVAELDTQMARLILEAMTQAMKEFKISPKMQNLNIEFGQKAFIKSFKLCKDRVAQRFPELDLSFLEEEKDVVDVGPSNAVVDPFFNELASGPSKPTTEAPEPIQKPEVVESDPDPSFIIPFEVEILE